MSRFCCVCQHSFHDALFRRTWLPLRCLLGSEKLLRLKSWLICRQGLRGSSPKIAASFIRPHGTKPLKYSFKVGFVIKVQTFPFSWSMVMQSQPFGVPLFNHKDAKLALLHSCGREGDLSDRISKPVLGNKTHKVRFHLHYSFDITFDNLLSMPLLPNCIKRCFRNVF